MLKKFPGICGTCCLRQRAPNCYAICGILAPIVTFTLMFLSISSHPIFSWTGDCLSDLGVVAGNTGFIYNTAMIAGGLLALGFAFGLFSQTGKISAAIFILVALSLAAIGVFPENARPYHIWASQAFFILFPISMLFAAKHFWKDRKLLASFTLALVVITIAGGILNEMGVFGPGCAIAEMIGAVCVGAWAAVLGIKMLRAPPAVSAA